MIKAFLFDLDGVLVHTDQLHYKAWKQLADKLNIPFSTQQADRCRGVSRMESLEIVLENCEQSFSKEQKLKMAEQKNADYQKFLKALSPADIPAEILYTLKELKARGFKLAVASSSKNALLILSQTKLLPLFDAVADGNDITRSKPDPEVFLTAAKKLDVLPENCAAIDDAQSGIEAAKAAKMLAVGIENSAALKLGNHNISSLSELLNLF